MRVRIAVGIAVGVRLTTPLSIHSLLVLTTDSRVVTDESSSQVQLVYKYTLAHAHIMCVCVRVCVCVCMYVYSDSTCSLTLK